MSTEFPECLEDIRQRWMTGAIVTKPALLEAYEAGRMAGKREVLKAVARNNDAHDHTLRIFTNDDEEFKWRHVSHESTFTRKGDTVGSLIEYLDAQQEAGE